MEARKEWEINLSKITWLDRPTNGDASETALIKFFQPIQDIKYTRDQYPLIIDKEGKKASMPFNSTNKYAYLIVAYERPDSHYCLFSKGAPEKIWNLCESIYDNGLIVPKSESWEKSYE